MGVSCAGSDQYMHKFWPAEAPWKTEPLITRRPPSSLLTCPFTNCGRTFVEGDALRRHLRCGHSLFQIKRRFKLPGLSGVQWSGGPR
jgi:hypothetical protein